MIKDVVKVLSKHHKYFKISPPSWSRIGKICDRYGEETVTKAIKSTPERELPLNDILNIVERRCQFILENGEIDDLFKEILDIGT